MLFNSYEFILMFLPITLILYFTCNHFHRYALGKCILVIASFYFYAYFNWSYFMIIASSIAINFVINKCMRYLSDKKVIKKLLLMGGLLANIGLLFYFKYFDFLITNLNLVFGQDWNLLNVVMPLGISFFTFQQLSYLVDSYRGEVPDYNLLDYALFVSFFPQLVAGPIVLHDEMVPQFANEHNKTFCFDNFSKGLYALSIGLMKKVIIADTFGKIVDFGFGNPGNLGSLESIMVILAYTIQIYFDFSGYCDMATGIALMFNIELPQNFNSPYKAADIGEFWKRWHMTLTRFLTKYIYIPLGGNRKGVARTYVNIFLVFFISGIWHGAGYTFILWGMLHGLASVCNRIFKKQVERIPFFVKWVTTFVFLNITWTYFRAPSIAAAHQVFAGLFRGGWTISAELTETLLQPFFISIPSQILSFVVVMAAFFILAFIIAFFTKNTTQQLQVFKPTLWSGIATYLMLVISVLSLSGVSSFLYFNF